MSDADDLNRLASIRADLAYFKTAHERSRLGEQPPMVYAAKYVDDVEFLMALADRIAGVVAEAPAPAGKSELEVALAHDEAGRVERTDRDPSAPTP